VTMRRSVIVILVLVTSLTSDRAFAQPPDESPVAPPVIESPAPPTATLKPDEHHLSEFTKEEREDATFMLGELRSHVRTFPDGAAGRLKLAQGLYRVGDLDAAIEECRVAIRLKPDDAKAHLQLGVMLMAKQDYRAAASVLKEAIRLQPDLTHAHYSLGSVQYSLGNAKAAIQSYRQAIELQPHFPDARYKLALLLKLSSREQEAAQLMEDAARGGIPQAQFFLGNAYKNGQGVDKNLGMAIFWWNKAVELGHQPAADALSKLRRQALAPDLPDRKRKDLHEAFQAYRDKLWDEVPDYRRTDASETLGTRLVKDNRTDRAPAALLKECYALGEVAQAELAKLYETGWDQRLAPFDKTILACLETTAVEGFTPAKKHLARIYAKGLGVPSDLQKAKALAKALPKQEAKALLEELGL